MSQSSPQPFVALPGSERQPFTDVAPGCRDVGPVPPTEEIEVSIYLKPPASSPPSSQPGQPISREAYAAWASASADDLEQIKQFARQYGLSVVEADPVGRVVKLRGYAAAMQQAFGVELRHYEHNNDRYRVRSGPVMVPQNLAPLVSGVLGLDNRLQTRRRQPTALAADTAITYATPQIASLYHFPTQGSGQGQTIGIIELGGGYRPSDLQTYFQQLSLPLPEVASVLVDGGQNTPTDPQSADGEVALDIEVAGAVAPGARMVVYFAPNTDRGFLDAITRAIHDTQNAPSVLSISWGGPESTWTGQTLQLMDQAFQTGGTLGVTICCAAGDHGARDGVTTDTLAHVDFPASSPNVLACGGTRLESANDAITSEIVWNNGDGWATGGGVSDVFDQPTWQANVQIQSINPGSRIGRSLPDVAGNADPQTGYQVLVDGQSLVVGGTSAVAPLWAGLIALLNQQLGKPVGFLTPILYQQITQTQVFYDILSGDNDGYAAGPGWDACTGWGSPDGANLLNALKGLL